MTKPDDEPLLSWEELREISREISGEPDAEIYILAEEEEPLTDSPSDVV